MTIKVVDSGYLRATELHDWLSANVDHVAALTDYCGMEIYKNKGLGTFKALEVLSLFPKQVIVLKNTNAVCGLKTRAKGIRGRLIDDKQTALLQRYFAAIHAAEHGDSHVRSRLTQLSDAADAGLSKIIATAQGLKHTIGKIVDSYSPTYLKNLRTRQGMSTEMFDEFIRNVMLLSADVIKNYDTSKDLPRFEELHNHFIFRYSLCCNFLIHRWIADGGVSSVRDVRMRNDLVDMNYVAYATYFDGFLSKDTKAIDIYRDASSLLKHWPAQQ